MSALLGLIAAIPFFIFAALQTQRHTHLQHKQTPPPPTGAKARERQERDHDDDPTEAAERTDTGRLLVGPPLEAGRGCVVAPRRAAGAAVRHAGWRVVAAHVKVSCSC